MTKLSQFWRTAHLFECPDDEAQSSEDVEVGRQCGDASDDCLNDERRHERSLATELVRQEPEEDCAEHHSEVEHHLRRFRQHVAVAHEVPLPEKNNAGTQIKKT